MERELALEFVRVTELAALSSAPWMGRGEKNAADGAATEAMRACSIPSRSGARSSSARAKWTRRRCSISARSSATAQGPEVDVAVDPLEGTESVAKGLNNAMSVIAVAQKGHLLHAPDMYMEKLAVGPRWPASSACRIRWRRRWTTAAIALGKPVPI